MMKDEIIKNMIEDSEDMGGTEDAWNEIAERVATFIKIAYDESELDKFIKCINKGKDYWTRRGSLIGYLEGLLIRSDILANPKTFTASPSLVNYDTTKVFLVHGHATEAKETVARFVQKIGLKPVILHEQPSSGLTIIEKLEAFSNVGFAVILLTPDDVGGLATSPKELNMRARQNVILELGYFLGKLSRNRVCALYKQGVEIPSDYGSVVFIELDDKGAWRTKLAQEFVHAGMAIEIEGLLET